MTKPINITDLREKLQKGEVKFQYTKKNGEVRTAVGTLNPDFIDYTKAGGKCPPKEAGYFIYWDIKAEEFRCFSEEKLIGLVEE